MRWILLALFGLMLTVASPTQAQEVVWRAEIYDNPDLLAPVAVERRYNQINLDWGVGSPADEISPDRFSIRFSTEAYFPADTYRFTIRADDAVRLLVDGVVWFDNFGAGQAGEVLTVDVPLTEGVHQLQLDYRELTGFAYVTLSWRTTALDTPGAPIQNDVWTATYYPNQSLSGEPQTIVEEITPTHNWGTGAPYAGLPVDNFSARFTSSLYLSEALYRFQVRADDGVRLYVDNQLLIDEWHTATGELYTAAVTLTSGFHTVVLEYYENTGLAFVTLDFTFSPVAAVPAPPPQLTVDAGILNVRDVPSTVTGDVIAKLQRGETYTVLATNADRTWYEINVRPGLDGWVSARYAATSNVDEVPVFDYRSEVPRLVPDEYDVVALTRVNVRSAPTSEGDLRAVMQLGDTAQILGRNEETTWLLVDYAGIVGWVDFRFVEATELLRFQLIPVLEIT